VAIKVEACDTWFSRCVRKRANFQCEHCGSTQNLQCSHIVGRRVKSLRWDSMNSTCLCAACHMRFTENPLDHVRWLEKHLGRQHLAILQEKRNTLLKTTKQLRREIAAHYREQFNTMEDGDEFESWS
jgi:hypothetical protein